MPNLTLEKLLKPICRSLNRDFVLADGLQPFCVHWQIKLVIVHLTVKRVLRIGCTISPTSCLNISGGMGHVNSLKDAIKLLEVTANT